MLRITTSHSAEGAKKYFDVSLKTSDLYTKDVGTWGGKGAEMLGLKGEVERKDFVALVRCIPPLPSTFSKTSCPNIARSLPS
jgi:hypothetical protein